MFKLQEPVNYRENHCSQTTSDSSVVREVDKTVLFLVSNRERFQRSFVTKKYLQQNPLTRVPCRSVPDPQSLQMGTSQSLNSMVYRCRTAQCQTTVAICQRSPQISGILKSLRSLESLVRRIRASDQGEAFSRQKTCSLA